MLLFFGLMVQILMYALLFGLATLILWFFAPHGSGFGFLSGFAAILAFGSAACVTVLSATVFLTTFFVGDTRDPLLILIAIGLSCFTGLLYQATCFVWDRL